MAIIERLIIISVFYVTTVISETVISTGQSTVECVDTATPCTIVCDQLDICRGKLIRCHRTANQPCTLHFNATNSAYGATIYTHQSPLVHIHATSADSVRSATIYAHEKLSSKLYIFASGSTAMYATTIYAPVGEGSLLHFKAGQQSAREVDIYDDWTTEVYLQSMGNDAFHQATVSNIFDASSLNISRTDSAYTGLNTAYRAPVFLNNCDQSTAAFWKFAYHGHNHGAWTVYATGQNAFFQATINATASIAPYDGVSGYDIKLIVAPPGTTVDDDSEISTYALAALTIDANQAGANVYAESTSIKGLYDVTIYAKLADSVNVWCHDGGDCGLMSIECPEDNQNNACMVYCDDHGNTDCHEVSLYTTNGLCTDGAVLCYGSDNWCELRNSRVICGYETTNDYCKYDYSATIYPCTDTGGTCSNGYNEQTCDNFIGGSPIAISSSFSTDCSADPVTATTTEVPTTSNPTTSIPSATNPTTQNPTSHTNIPTAVPTRDGIIRSISTTPNSVSVSSTLSIGADGEVQETETSDSPQQQSTSSVQSESVVLVVLILCSAILLIVSCCTISRMIQTKRNSVTNTMIANTKEDESGKSPTDKNNSISSVVYSEQSSQMPMDFVAPQQAGDGRVSVQPGSAEFRTLHNQANSDGVEIVYEGKRGDEGDLATLPVLAMAASSRSGSQLFGTFVNTTNDGLTRRSADNLAYTADGDQLDKEHPEKEQIALPMTTRGDTDGDEAVMPALPATTRGPHQDELPMTSTTRADGDDGALPMTRTLADDEV